MSNFIVPLSSLPSITSIADQKAGVTKESSISGLPFADVLQNAMQGIADTKEQSGDSMYNLAIGGSDDLHTGAIDGLKYSTAVSYASGLASNVVRAYNELMRMSI